MTNEVKCNENLVCEECGRYGAYAFGDRRLCFDCYEAKESCCPELGREDVELEEAQLALQG